MQSLSRSDLHTKLVTAFALLDEVHSIHVFGREVDGDIDEYSDIDLVVCSDDLARTQQRNLAILNSISPIRAMYQLVSDEHELVRMIMFTDYNPYQKIDFEITDKIERKQAFAPFKCLYRRSQPAGESPTALQPENTGATLANQLNDILFSIPRFTKCIFRQDRDLYRRWIGIVERLCVLLYERQHGWREVSPTRLTPPQYKALHKSLTAGDENRMDAIWPMNHDPCLPEGFRLAVEWIVELTTQKSSELNQTVDLHFARYMQQFLIDELVRAGIEM